MKEEKAYLRQGQQRSRDDEEEEQRDPIETESGASPTHRTGAETLQADRRYEIGGGGGRNRVDLLPLRTWSAFRAASRRSKHRLNSTQRKEN